MFAFERSESCTEQQYLAHNAIKAAEKLDPRAVSATHTTLPSYAASEASELAHFLSEVSNRDSASQDLPDDPALQETIEEMDRKELRDLAFPFLLADPSKPFCPVVAFSDGFADLTGYDAGEILGQKAACHLRGKQVAQFLEFSCRSELCPATLTSGSELCLVEDGELAEGELVAMQSHSTRSGENFVCVTFLKQVYLEDEMFVVALQASPEGEDDDSLKACVLQLKRNAEASLQVLAKLFWLSAPIGRLSNGPIPQVKKFTEAEVALHTLAAQSASAGC